MGRIVITGAAGRIGQAMVRELAPGHELVLLDRRRVPGWQSVKVDLGREPGWPSRVFNPRNRLPRWAQVFARADSVLHLAGDPSPVATWRKVLRDNVTATWNVLEAARSHGVPRVVFASSCHAALGWEQELEAPRGVGDSDNYGEEIIDRPHRPVSPYGLSKAWGELAGRMLVETGQLKSFLAVRIGAYSPRPPSDEAIRRRWVIPGDLHWILARCLEVHFSGFQVIYGVTALPGAVACPARLASLLGPRSGG